MYKRILLLLFLFIGAVNAQLIEQREVKNLSDSLLAKLLKSANLADLPNKTTARNNLSVYSKTYLDSIHGTFLELTDTTSLIPTKNFISTNHYTKAEARALVHDSLATIIIPDSLNDLPGDATHRLVTDAEKSTWNNKRDLTNHDSLSTLDEKKFASLTDKPTTLSGYGITDAYTKTQTDSLDNADSSWVATQLSSYFLTSNFNSTFDARLGTKNSDSLSEGSINKYYTDARADLKSNITDIDSLSRLAFSSLATGLTYTNTTGVFSWASGYTGLTDSMRTYWSAKLGSVDSALYGTHYYINSQGFLKSADIAGKVDTSRTLTINGLGYSLGANRSWTIATDSTLYGTHYYINNQGFLKWSDTTASLPTKAFLSLNHYTKTSINTLLGAKQDTTYLSGLTSNVQAQINSKQATLVSATNIKSINSNSLLGSGDISVATLIGYTPENVANKDTAQALGTDNTKYPTQKAVKGYADTKIPLTYLDTDITLTANSDVKIASQKATKAFVDSVNRGHSVFCDNGYIPELKDRWVNWDSTSGAGDCYLSPGIEGELHTFKKIDNSTTPLVLYPDGIETIDGLASYTLNNPRQEVTVHFTNGNWYIVSTVEFNLTFAGKFIDTSTLSNGYRLYMDADTVKGTAATGSVGNADSLINIAGSQFLQKADSTLYATQANLAALPVLSDGDKGDISLTSSGTVWTIDNQAVTFAKFQNIGTGTIIGRQASGDGVSKALTVGDGLTLSGDSIKTSLSVINIGGLQDSLNARSKTGHLHTVSNITGLQDSLNARSKTGHLHIVGNITGLTDSLNTRVKYTDSLTIFTTPTQAKGLIADTMAARLSVYWDSTKVKSVISDSIAGKQDALGYIPVDISDSTGVNGYGTQNDLLAKVNKSDSTGVNGYATQDDLNAKVNKADSTGRGYATQDDLEKLQRIVKIKMIGDATAAATTDSVTFNIPYQFNGYNLVDADAAISTVSSSGTPTFTLTNVTDATTMLSTSITIDATEYTSYTAATAPVIDTSYDDVATGDRIKIKCTVAGTGTKGSEVTLVFQKP